MGMEPRYVPVPVTDGLTVQVRVLSIHEDDNPYRELLYTADLYFDWCNEKYRALVGYNDARSGEYVSGAEPGAALENAKQLARCQIDRDAAIRKALETALHKHGVDEIRDKIIPACSVNSAMTIFLVAKGENQRMNRLLSLVGDNPRIETLQKLATEDPVIDSVIELCRDKKKLEQVLQALKSPSESAA